jgi:hypothetical protein
MCLVFDFLTSVHMYTKLYTYVFLLYRNTYVYIIYVYNINTRMVKSALHTKIEYAETRRMDPEDKAHDTVVYLCDILSDEVFYHMTLGKEHNDFSHYGVYYYPIYLISEKRKVRGKVGVYEILSRNRIDLRDKDDDIDIQKLGKPLIFSHVTKEYLEKYGFRAPDDSDDVEDSDPDNDSLQETETPKSCR